MDLFNKKKVAELEKQLENSNRTLLERDLMANALGVSHGGKRDTYEVYGYPKQTHFHLLYQYARRSGIAGRIVFGKPKSCWRDGFELFPDDEMKEDSELIPEDVQILNGKMIDALERVDALNRIGKFSALFVGVPDGLEPDQPLGRVMGDAINSVYFRPFAYDGIEVSKYNMDPLSERYGMPELYQMQVMTRGQSEKEQNLTPIIAHYSRVVHVVENRFDSEIEGVPALEAVFNRVLDIEKATGGASEAYFRNARGKFSFEVDPEFGTDLISNQEAKNNFDDAGKKFTNDQQDMIVALGSKVTSHSTPHASPVDTIKVALWDISAREQTPIRLLTGEGAGQLAGSEDKLAYNVVIDDRKNTFCESILRDTLGILTDSGVIDLPESYYVNWPKQDATTELEAAEVGSKRAMALQQVVAAKSSIGGDAIDLRSALDTVYLNDVEIDELELDYYGEESDQDGADRESMAEGDQPPMGDTE